MIKRAVNGAHVGTLKEMGDRTLRSDLLMFFMFEKPINTETAENRKIYLGLEQTFSMLNTDSSY